MRNVWEQNWLSVCTFPFIEFYIELKQKIQRVDRKVKAILTKKQLHELKSFNMFKLFNLMNSVSFPLLDGWRLATFTF